MTLIHPLEKTMHAAVERYFTVNELRCLATEFISFKITETTVFSELTRLHYAMFGGASPEIEQAAAAVDMMILALDIYDDVQDQDNDTVPWAHIPPAIALNVAIGMQALSIAMLQDCAFPAQARERAVYYLNLGILKAVNGQQVDLQDQVTTEEDCIAMIRGKSGALAACACLVGTALATDQHHDLVAEYGSGLGIVAQMRNDMKGITRWDVRNDLLQRKKTLPILYVLEQDHELAQLIREYYEHQREKEDIYTYKVEILDLVHASGAMDYAEVLVRLQQFEARAIIDNLPILDEWKGRLYPYFM
ncbi:polyprenyl synthetase family protein [Paenibacillus sp. N1-5-1-14]|uniref:polyprenyl synthetase family protein n=1 Tax=Paenibacillus radicibacter TaxID=2972488 RepID=UPI002159A6F5|nr:polyprenyl synthetase family protein [Paenibacillus radicibacter]MCR8643557.1 polyprenyl synthetase family protein [Paenibacillus radicibacter]